MRKLMRYDFKINHQVGFVKHSIKMYTTVEQILITPFMSRERNIKNLKTEKEGLDQYLKEVNLLTTKLEKIMVKMCSSKLSLDNFSSY